MNSCVAQKNTSEMRQRLAMFIAVGVALMCYSTGALAADEMGDGVCGLVNVLTGKWLFGFTILAIIGGGCGVLMGGEITDLLKKIATIITAVGCILGAVQIIALAYSKFASMTC